MLLTLMYSTLKRDKMKSTIKLISKINQGLHLAVLSLCCVIMVCCSKQYVNDQTPEFSTTKNFVSVDDAKNLLDKVGAITHTKSGEDAKFTDIESVTQVSDSMGNAIFYAVNYKAGGFILLSADNRTQPVLAFSDTNKFSVEAIPHTGLWEWTSMTTDQISEIRMKNIEQSPDMAKMWEPEAIVMMMSGGDIDDRLPDDDPNICPYPDIYLDYGPLIGTVWGQGPGFNNNVPYVCDGNKRAPAGCVPVAMGQIMKYYNYPTHYNWSQIENVGGGDETSKLLSDIGYYMGVEYGCDGSGAYTKDAPRVFTQYFGYRSASISDYNYLIVKNELSVGRPVIMRAARKTGSILFPKEENGHAWICDGMIYREYCMHDYSAATVSHGCTAVISLYMRWGWNGTGDGYFKADWNPNNQYNFDYHRQVIHNIIP